MILLIFLEEVRMGAEKCGICDGKYLIVADFLVHFNWFSANLHRGVRNGKDMKKGNLTAALPLC